MDTIKVSWLKPLASKGELRVMPQNKADASSTLWVIVFVGSVQRLSYSSVTLINLLININ